MYQGTRRAHRAVLTVVAILALFIPGARTALAAGAAGTAAPSAGPRIPSEATLSTTANPNLTPLLFTQDPSESAQVYAKSQAFAAQNVTTCGTGATAGACCPISSSDGACDDHDPSVTGCADASSVTVTQANIVDNAGTVIGLIETRYSPTCQTNWGRITGFGAYAGAVKQTTVCRGEQAEYADSGCSDTDTGTESTRFSDQLYAPTECAFAVGTLVLAGTSGTPSEYSATTPLAC